MKVLSTLIGSIVMAEPSFLFESNSVIRAGGSCKARQEWIEANPDVQIVSSCPAAEEIFLNKLENGTFVHSNDKQDNFEEKWNTVNSQRADLACKFLQIINN